MSWVVVANVAGIVAVGASAVSVGILAFLLRVRRTAAAHDQQSMPANAIWHQGNLYVRQQTGVQQDDDGPKWAG